MMYREAERLHESSCALFSFGVNESRRNRSRLIVGEGPMGETIKVDPASSAVFDTYLQCGSTRKTRQTPDLDLEAQACHRWLVLRLARQSATQRWLPTECTQSQE